MIQWITVCVLYSLVPGTSTVAGIVLVLVHVDSLIDSVRISWYSIRVLGSHYLYKLTVATPSTNIPYT
jgi:hypothetical protein